MKENSNLLLILVLIVISLTRPVVPFDLPEVIAVIEDDNMRNFAWTFCCIGDHNKDGFDDLIVTHDPYMPGLEPPIANSVNVYNGGEQMDNDIDFRFMGGDSVGFPYRPLFAGHLMPHLSEFFIITSYFYENNVPAFQRLNFYQSTVELQNDPHFSMMRRLGNNEIGISNRVSIFNTPPNFNGDSYSDLVLIHHIDESVNLEIFYGGAEFDTLSDWIKSFDHDPNIMYSVQYSSGFDLNADGYDDLLVKSKEEFPGLRDRQYYYRIFLGGSPMDTIPDLIYHARQFWDDGISLSEGFCMLQDVNGDGYDDWGHYWYHWRNDVSDGVVIFYGGEELDIEPDHIFNGFHARMSYQGRIAGGDFNNDGYGDIVAGQNSAFLYDGGINIYFGAPDPHRSPAVEINGLEDFNARRLGGAIGAVGDYNGDGIDDFVAQTKAYSTLHIFAGSSDWRTIPPRPEIPEVFEIEITGYPNPFNSEIQFKYSTNRDGMAEISLFNINGEEIETIFKGNLLTGIHQSRWQVKDQSTGIYFVRFSMNPGNTELTTCQKIVFIK